MCAIIAPILGVMASALSLASTVQQSSASQVQYYYETAEAEQEVQVQEVETEKVREDVSYGEEQLRSQQQAELGTQRSLLASQGYSLGDLDGSAATFLMQESGRHEEDAYRYAKEGEYEVWRAENSLYSSQIDAAQVKSQPSTSLLDVGQSALKTGQSVANAWYSYA